MMMQDTWKKDVLQKKVQRFSKLAHEDWFLELSNLEIAFITEYMDLYENKPQEFLELLANRKKQRAIFLKLSKTVNTKANMKEQRESVEQFLQQVSLHRILTDFSVLPFAADYIVEKNVANYVIAHKEDEELIPFTEDAFYDGELHISLYDQSFVISVQSLIYFLFVNEIHHRLDEKRIVDCKCEHPEATFAKSYVKAALEEDLTGFFVLKNSNFMTSMLFAMATYVKTIRYVTDAFLLPELEAELDFIDELQNDVPFLMVKKEEVLSVCYDNYLSKKVEKFEQKEMQQAKKFAELQQKLDKQKEKFDEQLEKAQLLKKELTTKAAATVTSAKVEKKIGEQTNELKQQLKIVKEEAKEAKKIYQKERDNAERKLENALSENERLVGNVSSLQQQLTAEKRLKLQTEELTFAKWLQKGRDFIQHMTLDEEKDMKDFIAIAENMMQERSLARPKNDLSSNRVGHCRVDERGHFVNFGDGEWHEILHIPSNTYLSDAQFVEVTKDIEFVRPFIYFYTEGPQDHTITHFVAIEERHNQAFAKVNGKLTQIKYRDTAFIKHDQVISINASEELVSYYRNRSIQLDDWLPSIHVKRHEPLYVLMALANGYVVRGLNENQRYLELNQDLLAHSFIIVDEEEQVQYVEQSGLMYKGSSLYKYKQLASVSEMEDDIYVLKQNQEYVQLHDVPKTVQLELGDMVWVDEYNRFIECMEVEEQYIAADTIEKKLLDGGRKVTRKTKTQVMKDKELLIIGNIRISERYKKYFAEFGYEVEVVDGTGPFEKIRQACSKFNTILYSTAFTSHKNSGKMNLEVAKPYILCDSTAPKVMHFALDSVG
ncbi:MAG: hypothetical protein ABS942_16445 [Solibacillus sp.]